MSEDEPRAIDALKGEGTVHVFESPLEGVYTPVVVTGRERFNQLFTAAFTFHLIGEGAYLHDHFRAYFAASDWLSFDGEHPPKGVRQSEAEVLRKVADIRDPDEPDTWDDYDSGRVET